MSYFLIPFFQLWPSRPWMLAWLFLLSTWIAPAFAQEASDTLQFNSTLSLGGMIQRGVLDQTNVNGSFHASLHQYHWSATHTTTYAYVNANAVKLSDNWTALSILKRSIPGVSRISPTAIHVYKNNLLYRIKHSHRVLGGLSITPLKKRKSFWLFVGLGYDHTAYRGEVFDNSLLIDSVRAFPASLFYLENEHHLFQQKLSFRYELFFIQSLEERADFTLWLIPSLRFKLNQRFSLAVAYDYRYRNVHLEGIPAFNDLISFNLQLQFGQAANP
ncbi:MAG: DUF481 domain-containing protein [Bacteroidota bacterium]